MERFGTGNPYRDISRDQRRRLTATLLRQVESAEGEERLELLDQVVLVNMCVAHSIALRYRSRGIALEDLEQVANAALVRAVHQFDPGRHGDLLTYAVPTIRGELRHYFRDHGWVVRPPRRVQELQSRVIEERDRIDHDRAVSDVVEPPRPREQEIAEALDVPQEDVVEALTAEGCFTPASLDVQVGGEDSSTLGELLPDPDDSAERRAAEARVMLRPVMRRLPARHRRLLEMRFVQELTQQEIADELGVTQTQVSRLLAKILGDLRRGLGEITAGVQESPGQAPHPRS